MKQYWMALATAAILAQVVGPADAVAQMEAPGNEISESYGIYYGDGLRWLAEGEPDRAVKSLFRAYGLRPSGQVMTLIIEAYDEMGHCDAVERQRAMLEQEHPETPEMGLEYCEESVALELKCPDGEEPISLNGRRTLACHRVSRVPAGQELRLKGRESGQEQRHHLEAGEDHQLEWEWNKRQVDIARLLLSGGNIGRLGPQHDAEVPRVPSQRLESHYDRSDGVFHVWQSDRVDDAEGPTVELICPDGTASSGERCILLRDDNGQRNYDVLVPRLP